MSARKARKPKAPKTSTPKPDRETIPLAALSITVTPPTYFTTTKSEPVTFEGEALAAALRWIALNCPNVPFFTNPQRVGFELMGVAEQCRAIGDADLEVIPADSNALFCSLADRLKDLAYRIAAGDKHYRKLEDDMVTITRKPAEGAS
jgi:hypothetical protein